jgi:hypothetical protein
MRAKEAAFLLPLALMLLCTFAPVHASTQPSIPIIGRYSVLTIKIYIPHTPQWAHDVVLNATMAWNQAQLLTVGNDGFGTVYRFVETDDGTATSVVSFSMPTAYASIAVGWTNYKFATGSRTAITSTTTYLTPTIFNAAQGTNYTAERYAFWLALHESGRILGLGSLMDGKDIMEPRYFAARFLEAPQFSTLDLYALHVLAQGDAPAFVTLPDGVQNQFAPAMSFLNPQQEVMAPTLTINTPTQTAIVQVPQPALTPPTSRNVRFFRMIPI